MPEQHCVVHLATGKTNCYATFAEGMNSLGGRYRGVQSPSQITDTPSNATQMSTTSTLSAAAETVIGILFDNVEYSGQTYTYAQYNPCKNTTYNVDYQATIPGFFNDRTSSYRGYFNCLIKIFDNTYSGDSDGPQPYRNNLRNQLMNDRASSVQFY